MEAKNIFYKILFILLLQTGESFSQHTNLDNLSEKLNTTKHDSLWVGNAKLLFDQLLERDINRAEVLNKEIASVSNRIAFRPGVALAYKQQGEIYYYQLQFDSARMYLDSAMTVYQEINDSTGIASVLTAMGINFIINRQEMKGAEMLYQSLKLCESSNNKYLIALNFENLGLINDRVKNYSKAEFYHKAALELFIQINNSDKIVLVQYNYGTSLMESLRLDEALIHLKEGSALCETIENNFILTGFYEGIGSCYLMMDTLNTNMSSAKQDSLLNEALYYLRKSEKVIFDHGYTENLANITVRIGYVYFKMGNYINAQEYSIKALDLAEQSHLLNIKTDAYRQLFEIHVAQGNPSKALEYHQQYKFWNDSMYSNDKRARIENISQQFESEKKEREILLLKSENEIQLLKTERGRLVNFVFAGGMILLIASTFIYFKQSSQRKQVNAELQKAYTDLANTQAQLVQQEKLTLLGKLVSRVAHEIQNPLNFVNNFSEISGELIDEYERTEPGEEKYELFRSLRENIIKTNYHGKRADGMIKKIQQHLNDGTGLDFFEG